MKKLIVTFILILVLITGLWIFLPTNFFDKNDFFQSSLVLIPVVVLGLWVTFKRFISHKNEEPAEDELSRLILQRSASLSYYISLYLWLVISYISDKVDLETEQLIGYGIIGMALLFVGFWTFYTIRGIKLN